MTEMPGKIISFADDTVILLLWLNQIMKMSSTVQILLKYDIKIL